MKEKQLLDLAKKQFLYNEHLDVVEIEPRDLIAFAEGIVKLFAIPSVSGSLPNEVYATYDTSDGEVFCAFTDKQQCEKEAKESGCGMQTIRLYSNDR